MEVVAGIVVYNENLGRFLVLQSKYGYDLPKGHLENNELPLEGAIRECYEETGLQPLLVPDWHLFFQSLGKQYHFYLGKVHTRGVVLSPEHDRAFWATADFANQLKLPLNIVLQTAAVALQQ